MKRFLNLALFCVALSALRAASASPSEIALVHITIIDLRTGAIEPDMTVLIAGDRISSVRPTQIKARLPETEMQEIDGRGKFLIPGLWDMHVHTDGDDRILRLLLANGVTRHPRYATWNLGSIDFSLCAS